MIYALSVVICYAKIDKRYTFVYIESNLQVKNREGISEFVFGP